MFPFSVRLDCLLRSAAILGTECLVVWVLLHGECVPQKTSVSFTCKPQCAVKREGCSRRAPGERRESGSKGWWARFSETWYQRQHLKAENAFRAHHTLLIRQVQFPGRSKKEMFQRKSPTWAGSCQPLGLVGSVGSVPNHTWSAAWQHTDSSGGALGMEDRGECFTVWHFNHLIRCCLFFFPEDDMNNYISRYYNEPSSGKFCFKM